MSWRSALQRSASRAAANPSARARPLSVTHLRDHIHGLAHARRHGQQLALLIHCQQHARLHGSCQAVEQAVVLAPQGGLQVQAAGHYCQQARQ